MPGARGASAQYQYTLYGSDLQELNSWSPKIEAALRQLHQLADLNSDKQNKGIQINLIIDHDTASRLGVTTQAIDSTLYDAFGQRQVSTTYKAVEPVPCGDGGSAPILAAGGYPQRYLCGQQQGHSCSFKRICPL